VKKLRFLDPETFVELGRLKVFDRGKRVKNLNELEFVDGKIYANVLPQARIAIIPTMRGSPAARRPGKESSLESHFPKYEHELAYACSCRNSQEKS
jgi:hypothetical protein